MEIPNQETDMPIPINTTYGLTHHHLIHHDPTSQNHIIVPSSDIHVNNSFKKTLKYKECLKNHAASMGGNATDGCGEFMPSGEEGSLEALTCSACKCHRNFHRKENEGELSFPNFHENYCFPNLSPRIGRKIFVGGHNHNAMSALIASRPMLMSYNMGGNLPTESEEEVGVRTPHVKKRFRTKFTQEQKEKMLDFAEKVEWMIQKQEESVVQQFCQEIGVKRRVLKVWMHNNKHSLAKKKNNNGNGEANEGGNDQV